MAERLSFRAKRAVNVVFRKEQWKYWPKKKDYPGSQFINLLGTDHSIKIAHVQINIIRTSHVRCNHPQQQRKRINKKGITSRSTRDMATIFFDR